MARLGPCETCLENGQHTQATLVIDGNPVCGMHAHSIPIVERLEEAPVIEKEQIVPSRSTVLGTLSTQKPVTTTAVTKPAKTTSGTVTHHTPKKAKYNPMDTLVCEEIDERDLPEESKEHKTGGRLGELWHRLLDLAPGKYLKVTNRDRAHATDTARHVRRKAKLNGRECSVQLVGADLYCKLMAPKQEAA